MRRRYRGEPCYCGATDCRECNPSGWWHGDECDGSDKCGCVEPGSDWPEP